MVPVALIARRVEDKAAAQAALSLHSPAVTFEDFRDLTEGLTGTERLDVFYALTEPLQATAWENLAQAIQDAEDAAVDPMDREYVPRQRTRLSTSDPVSFDKDAKDPLVTIPPPQYVAKLAGVEVGEWGTIRCVLPGHDHERTGSLKVHDTPERGWYCHGCHRGGSIFDFAGHLWGLPTRGSTFREIRKRLRRELLT